MSRFSRRRERSSSPTARAALGRARRGRRRRRCGPRTPRRGAASAARGDVFGFVARRDDVGAARPRVTLAMAPASRGVSGSRSARGAPAPPRTRARRCRLFLIAANRGERRRRCARGHPPPSRAASRRASSRKRREGYRAFSRLGVRSMARPAARTVKTKRCGAAAEARRIRHARGAARAARTLASALASWRDVAEATRREKRLLLKMPTRWARGSLATAFETCARRGAFFETRETRVGEDLRDLAISPSRRRSRRGSARRNPRAATRRRWRKSPRVGPVSPRARRPSRRGRRATTSTRFKNAPRASVVARLGARLFLRRRVARHRGGAERSGARHRRAPEDGCGPRGAAFFRLARRRGWFQKRASLRPTLRVARRREDASRIAFSSTTTRTRRHRRDLQTARRASGLRVPEPVETNGVARMDTNGT